MKTGSIRISKGGNRIHLTGSFANDFFKAAVAANTKWRSVAVWPADSGLSIDNNTSTDTHDTREQAEGVCKLLRENGFGGDGKIFPVETRVEEVR